MSKPKPNKMEKVVSLCKRRGFIFPGSEIYGGLANTWDYGPYGARLKQNVKDFWWQKFVRERDDMVGLDSSILMNAEVWKASGHIESFSDPLMDCKNCKERLRGDKLIEEKFGKNLFEYIKDLPGEIALAGDKHPLKASEVEKRQDNVIDLVSYIIINTPGFKCPKCGKHDFTEARSFNLMFKTHQGVIEETASVVYMRPETAQGIFVNFKNIQQSCRMKIPFGVAQIGKAFRNEITPGNFTYRTREFEQMEIEYFVSPADSKEIKRQFDEWKETAQQWFLDLGIKKENLRFREHDSDELSHYSTMTFDVEYMFPFGWGELMGLAYRGCYDLAQHQKFSGKNLEYQDPITNEKYLPHVIEPSFGCDRTILITLLDAYDEDTVGGEERVVMRFQPKIAPVKAAILPLMKKEELTKVAEPIYKKLRQKYDVEYDDSGAIGKRYRRQDEIGTPFCITIDYDSLEDKQVTLRYRDSTEQKRVKIDEIEDILAQELS